MTLAVAEALNPNKPNQISAHRHRVRGVERPRLKDARRDPGYWGIQCQLEDSAGVTAPGVGTVCNKPQSAQTPGHDIQPTRMPSTERLHGD